MPNLKEIRSGNKVSQSECAKLLGISLCSYKEYENNKDKENTLNVFLP